MTQESLTFIADSEKPLAEMLRPISLHEMLPPCGISSIMWKNLCASETKIPSMILWGPPGSGKTTLARAIGKTHPVIFHELSAVNAGVREVRELVQKTQGSARSLLLFLDEVHRFNKTQQDILLPLIEAGRIIFIGATTENPSFALTSALLSRCELIRLTGFDETTLSAILETSLRSLQETMPKDEQEALIQRAQGDARSLLRTLEHYLSLREEGLTTHSFLTQQGHVHYDRAGDQHFDSISAFIKSMRSGDTNSALYYGLRMIEAGEDPLYVLRRMVVFASEDIGNAQPQALMIANQALEAYKFLGLPEGKITISQAICFLSTAPKSRASYDALRKTEQFLKAHPNIPIPKKLKNSSSGDLLPDTTETERSTAQLKNQQFYIPTNAGYESKLLK